MNGKLLTSFPGATGWSGKQRHTDWRYRTNSAWTVSISPTISDETNCPNFANVMVRSFFFRTCINYILPKRVNWSINVFDDTMVALFRRQWSFKDSDCSLRYCFSLKSKLLIGQGNGVASSIHLRISSPRINAAFSIVNSWKTRSTWKTFECEGILCW